MSNPSANQSDENSVQRDQDQQAANSNSDSDYSSFEQSNDQDMNVDQCIFENDASEGDSADEEKSNLDDEDRADQLEDVWYEAISEFEYSFEKDCNYYPTDKERIFQEKLNDNKIREFCGGFHIFSIFNLLGSLNGFFKCDKCNDTVSLFIYDNWFVF